VAKLLIESGVDKDKATGDGATPLLIAREQGHLEVVELLIKSGKRKKTKKKKKRKKKTHTTAGAVQHERADQQEARLVAEKAGDGAAGARQELPEGSNKKKDSGHVCGRSGCGESNKPDMMICGKCQLTHYCDKQCHRADWKVHKTGCRRESIARRAREERALSLLATESEEDENGEEVEETKVEKEEKEETKEEAKEEMKEEAKAEEAKEEEDSSELGRQEQRVKAMEEAQEAAQVAPQMQAVEASEAAVMEGAGRGWGWGGGGEGGEGGGGGGGGRGGGGGGGGGGGQEAAERWGGFMRECQFAPRVLLPYHP
jgi:hypothetical protein